MTEPFSPKLHFPALELPAQDLAKLSFCGGNKPARLQAWADQLQAIRITHTSVQLYRSLPEIARLKTDVKTRLELLEIIRSSVYNNLTGLARQFLGQPLILPEPAQKAAIVAQALQRHLVLGYSVCVRDLIQQKSLNKQARGQLALALQRAAFSTGSLYLRNCQIYTQQPAGFWLHLHQLLRTGLHFDVADTLITDPLLHTRKACTLRETYLRPVMLACSGTNQLAQAELDRVYRATEDWAHWVDFVSSGSSGTASKTFSVGLSEDEPPTDKPTHEAPAGEQLTLSFARLAKALAARLEGSGRTDVQVQPNTPIELLQHLISAWQTASERQQHRHKVRTLVDVCVGLSECHYHLANGQSFGRFLGQLPLRERDAWASGFASGGHDSGGQTEEQFRVARVAVENVSSGGYCLYWQNQMPPQAVAGQLLGIREPGGNEWHLGVVRWVRQLRGASQMGVQVLALDSTPAAAYMLYDSGGYSDPSRVMSVASEAGGHGSATLITAAQPLQEYSRLRLLSGSRAWTVKLGECLFSSSKIRQFRYQILAAEADQVATGAAATPVAQQQPATGASGFDAEWNG